MGTGRCLTFSDSRLMHISGGSNFISLGAAVVSHHLTLMVRKENADADAPGHGLVLVLCMRRNKTSARIHASIVSSSSSLRTIGPNQQCSKTASAQQ
jgi:hypothetical protein